MSAPSTPHGRQQQEEAGGQPLVYGAIADGAVVLRSGYQLVGNSSAFPITGLRLVSFLIQNVDNGLYYTITCGNNADGKAELRLSDTGVA